MVASTSDTDTSTYFEDRKKGRTNKKPRYSSA